MTFSCQIFAKNFKIICILYDNIYLVYIRKKTFYDSLTTFLNTFHHHSYFYYVFFYGVMMLCFSRVKMACLIKALLKDI